MTNSPNIPKNLQTALHKLNALHQTISKFEHSFKYETRQLESAIEDIKEYLTTLKGGEKSLAQKSEAQLKASAHGKTAKDTSSNSTKSKKAFTSGENPKQKKETSLLLKQKKDKHNSQTN